MSLGLTREGNLATVTYDGQDWTVRWDSLSEAISDSKEKIASPVYPGNANNIQQSGDWSRRDGWLNNRNQRWADKVVAEPESDLMAAISTMRETLSGLPSFQQSAPKRKRLRNQDFGYEADSDLYRMRDPNMWERREKQEIPSRYVRLGVNVSVSCARVRQDLFWRGAAVCALADYLSANGYSLEIEACWGTSGAPGNSVATILVKPAGMPLDLASVASALCEIAIARRVTLLGQMGYANHRVDGSLGFPAPVKAHDYDIIAENDILSERDARRWLETAIAKVTGDVSQVGA